MKISILEEVKKIDVSKANYDNIVWCLNHICQASGFENWDSRYDESKRLVEFWIDRWICTDTEVGSKVYFLDGEFVCYSFQQYRKSDEIFYWVSGDLRIKTRNYLLTVVGEDNGLKHNILDFDIIETGVGR